MIIIGCALGGCIGEPETPSPWREIYDNGGTQASCTSLDNDLLQIDLHDASDELRIDYALSTSLGSASMRYEDGDWTADSFAQSNANEASGLKDYEVSGDDPTIWLRCGAAAQNVEWRLTVRTRDLPGLWADEAFPQVTPPDPAPSAGGG